jgi:hypothetical protein
VRRRPSTAPPGEYAALTGRTVVRVDELEALGLARSTIAHRCRVGGPWRRLLPAVVMLHARAPDRDDRRRAALLHAGPGAVLTGTDALQLHGMTRMPHPSGPVHVLVPTGRRRSGHGHVLVERTERLPLPAAGRWPLAPVERAVLDFARRSTSRAEVRAAIAEVVQRGRCPVERLCAELAAGSGRGAHVARAALAEIADGVRSAAEADARELLARAGMPPAAWNVALHDGCGRFLAVADGWFDGVALAWEIDSVEYHLSPADYARTVARRSAMSTAGIVVVQTLPSALRECPGEVLDELRRGLVAAARRPRPPIRADRAVP